VGQFLTPKVGQFSTPIDTPFVPYAQNPPISLESVAGHYGQKTSQVRDDIVRGIFPKDAIHEKNGKIFIDGSVVWKRYGKGETVNRLTTLKYSCILPTGLKPIGTRSPIHPL
jgi:hypothetical protein